MSPHSARLRLGAALYELPLALWGLRPAWFARGPAWTRVRNRRQRLIAAPHGPGVRCDWEWTSELHVARVFPRVGLWLLRRALREFPVEFSAGPPVAAGTPQVSFVVGHRGLERLPHVRATLASLAAQRGVSCECVLVEQSPLPQARPRLPDWVRYVHAPPPHADMPYNRAWAFNVGAAHARGELLVLHDNDMPAPRDYAAALWRRFEAGAEVINLKRFVFYLGAAASERLCAEARVPLDAPPESVVQNLEAGGSVAVAAAAYRALGGFDESFFGWGGEDNEFWERAQTRALDPFGYLPIVHLWHAPQAGKAHAAAAARARAHLDALSRRPPAERAAELRARAAGRLDGPRPPYVPAPAAESGPGVVASLPE